MTLVSVVGAALVRDGRVLASCRVAPPELAGGWELAGGKVEPGESDRAALVRELAEELRVTSVVVGDRLGPDLPIGRDAVMRVYLCTADGEPALVDHSEHRWLGPDDLDSVPWLPVDLPLLPLLRRALLDH